MAQYKSPESKALMMGMIIKSSLASMLLLAIAAGTFVFGMIETSIGILLLVLLLAIDTFIVLTTLKKIRSAEDQYKSENGSHV